MKAFLSLELQLKNELMTTVRLAVGGAASAAGLSYDDGEDCKVCVTESLLLLSRRGFKGARISFSEEKGLGVCVEGISKEGEEHTEGDEISVALLNALASGVVLERKGGSVNKITFRFVAEK